MTDLVRIKHGLIMGFDENAEIPKDDSSDEESSVDKKGDVVRIFLYFIPCQEGNQLIVHRSSIPRAFFFVPLLHHPISK
jgi:hypothetical protein